MRIRWGIMSTANIGVKSVIPAMLSSKLCQITAIASRSLARARETAGQFNIPKSYGAYDELLDDPNIDAVYIPLPNHLHVPWSIKAIQAGKHVLCEKPIGLNGKEAKQLLDISAQYPHIKVMEAFMYRFHPQWQIVTQLLNGGKIGELRSIETGFSYFNVDPNNVRNINGIGGGALLDIGCYCISLARFVLQDEPQRVFGAVEYDPVFHVDRLTSGILEFPGKRSTFTCSSQLFNNQHAIIQGLKGNIKIEKPFTPRPQEQARLTLTTDEAPEEFILDARDQYTLQVDQFSKAILENTDVPTSLEDAVANMRVIDALFKSAEKATWVAPG